MKELTTTFTDRIELTEAGVDVTYENLSEFDREWCSKVLREYFWIIPKWVQVIGVRYVDGDVCKDSNCAVAEVSVNYTYRQMCLSVGPSMFCIDTPESKRVHYLVHEMTHAILDPVVDYAREELKRLLGDDAPKYKGCVIDEFTHRLETVTQDLSWAIVQNSKETQHASENGTVPTRICSTAGRL